MKMRVAEYQSGAANSDSAAAGTRKIREAFNTKKQQSNGYLSTSEMAKWAVEYDPGRGFQPKLVAKAQNMWAKQRSDLEDTNHPIAKVVLVLL